MPPTPGAFHSSSSFTPSSEFHVLSAMRRQAAHFRAPEQRPFTEADAASTTILFGNLTPKHDALIEAVFQGCGYLCRALPTPRRANYETGVEYCNHGLCNPNYYTAGNLIDFLRDLQRDGLSAGEIVDRFVYFTIGGCGPCRFGMYESEYRQALEDAGFPGFRVLTFLAAAAIREGSRHPGLIFTLNFGLGMLNALILGDILFDLSYRIRPFEAEPGAADAAVADVLAALARHLKSQGKYEPFREIPRGSLARWLLILWKIRHHLRGPEWKEALEECRKRLAQVRVDWLRVLPVAKVTGEFYSALSEGEANYELYRYLERHGAEVRVDPITNLILYWLYEARLNNRRRKGLRPGYRKKEALLGFCSAFWTWQYRVAAQRLGGLAGEPEDQEKVGRLASACYDVLARGGEGHLVAGRALEAAEERNCHMFISVKPFGCMPATQSDGVLALLAARHPELVFLPLETLGEAEANALNRVEMALADARRRAREEFAQALAATGRTLDDIRRFVAARPEMQCPFYRFRRKTPPAGTAAQFVLHVAERMRHEGC
jgi:predicted nucleotide-binding protein (sugar kinase/HSP70/actin superfamily)